MLNSLKYQKELNKLRTDHEEIEGEIKDHMGRKVINQFLVQGLKKQKLALKEQIAVLEEMLNDTIVA